MKQDLNMNSDESAENNIPVKLHDFTENNVPSYVKLSDKYNDIMSSAATMLLVGIIGVIFIILVLTKVIPIPLNSETSWLFYSVMGGIFIIFIISGIVSFMHAKQVKIDADVEDKLIDEILLWSDENLSVNDLDRDLDLQQPDELLYFGRADKIKYALMHQFEDADEALIYELTEQIYQKLYENESNT
ncbi:MAG: hypothetical protein ACLRZ9_07085 [Eubacterium sp.]